MLRINDYECPKCGHIEELLNDDKNIPLCSKCSNEMTKIITKMTFELKYNPKTDICSWGFDGYNASQYWKDVKKARDDGHKVKGANEL